jgi:protein subunit release factor A
MNPDKENIKKEIENLESQMNDVNFWSDKARAQEVIQKIKDLKTELEGGSALDAGPAILNILAGAGGDDSEDWARMLLNMYLKYFDQLSHKASAWQETKITNINILHENKNDHGGYRNISLEIIGKNIVNTLMLGAFAKSSGLISLNTLKKTITNKFSEKGKNIVEKNISAVTKSYNYEEKGNKK